MLLTKLLYRKVVLHIMSQCNLSSLGCLSKKIPEKGDYYPTARREAFCLIYVYDDSLHFFRDWREADIYPFTEHRMNVWQPDDDETTD